MAKSETKTQKGAKPKQKNLKADSLKVAPNKYEMLTNKKRKSDDKQETTNEAKKPRLDKPKEIKQEQNESKEKKKTFVKKEKNFNPKNGASFKDKNKLVKNGKPEGAKLTMAEKKELKKKRRQQRLGENYETNVNMKKIWETLRREDTTEEARKKLCTCLYDNIKGKIYQMSMAHDTCRVIECLVQYGNERHRTGVYDELKDNLVELSKSKYARFMIKKLLTYCTKEQKDVIVKAFTGHVTKLIKHSFACQAVETIYNEHASLAQRTQMQLEFYDPTFALFNDQRYKTLKDVIDAQPFSKEKILENVKTILSSCINKTLLMFSLIHKIFLEYFQNCDAKQRAEMIDLLGEHLVHMVHTRDGTQVALHCVWFGTAKDRKKIVKALKSFVLKVAMEEHGHMLLLGIFDSVDDTKFISKAILEEMYRSTAEMFNNEYGRKVITYLIVPRDSRFFIKDYVKRLETGDASETSKKDPEIRKKELLEYSKPHLKQYLKKEISTLIFNGACGILVPLMLDKLNEDWTEVIQEIANVLLEKRYEPETANKNEDATAAKISHCIEEATVHFIIKQILTKDPERESKSSLTLSEALLSHKNSIFIRSWIECNRGCFTVVKLFETCNESNKRKLKILLEDCEDHLKSSKNAGAKILLTKLEELKK